ncbi:hypothetical protein BKA61DRAFT_600143 [Leptodontidium sp. MPI-SDFR-AT-0119]|nr:hypothetical protein BKA61DRAFT_600143 [Leptodontidium sp. MPI-SDFR-AT-0119]
MFTWTLSLWWGTHSQIHEKAGSPFMLFNMRSFSRSRIYIWNMRRTNLSASPRFKACQHDGDQDPKANQINMPMSVRYLDLSSDVQPPTATKWRKANKLILCRVPALLPIPLNFTCHPSHPTVRSRRSPSLYLAGYIGYNTSKCVMSDIPFIPAIERATSEMETTKRPNKAMG